MKRRFTQLIDIVLGSRFWALCSKEVVQIFRNGELVRGLLLSPTVFLILFGLALNPEVKDLKVGITDYNNSRASREFVEIFNQTDAFVINQYYVDREAMAADLAIGRLTVGVTIPPEFADDIARKRTAEVQVLYDAADANTAGIASGYINQLVSDYNLRQLDNRLAPASAALQQNQVQLQISVLYNPGLESSWFIVPGMIGVVLTMVGSQISSSLLVAEKEAGTLEQLMMTPASDTEVILAKVSPLLLLLTFDTLVALLVAKLAFDLPLQGNLLLFLTIGVLYFSIAISIGTLLASFAKSEQQVQMMIFLIVQPLFLLSGAISSTSNMPVFVQWLSYLNPMRYFIEICRGVLLKGVGFETLWPQVLVLLSFVTVLMTLSIRQFRRQFKS